MFSINTSLKKTKYFSFISNIQKDSLSDSVYCWIVFENSYFFNYEHNILLQSVHTFLKIDKKNLGCKYKSSGGSEVEYNFVWIIEYKTQEKIRWTKYERKFWCILADAVSEQDKKKKGFIFGIKKYFNFHLTFNHKLNVIRFHFHSQVLEMKKNEHKVEC